MRIARFASLVGLIHVAWLASLTLGTHPPLLSDSPMRFHSYLAQRQVILATPGISDNERNRLATMSNADFAAHQLTDAKTRCRDLVRSRRISSIGCVTHPSDSYAAKVVATINEATAEREWHSLNRPFYNVYPVVAEMVSGVNLSLSFEQVLLPYQAMAFQFSESDAPLLPIGRLHRRLHSVLWYSGPDTFPADPSDRMWVAILEFEGLIAPCITFPYCDPQSQVEEFLRYQRSHTQDAVDARMRLEQRDSEAAIVDALARGEPATPDARFGVTLVYTQAAEWCFRLLVLTSLLAAGNDLVTPVLLAKDQDAMGNVSPEEMAKWVEMRASKARQRGLLGFEVGRALQEEKDRSPHFRNPHLALFHTGPGRTQPRVQLRRGSVVISKALTKVPTGFLGPETPEELASCEAVRVREHISARTRFFILKRDDYCCQICGASPKTDAGTQLHIDHKEPVAAGGSSDISNLWVLCSRCNLGKGVEPL
jgi:hypothetical protein